MPKRAKGQELVSSTGGKREWHHQSVELQELRLIDDRLDRDRCPRRVPQLPNGIRVSLRHQWWALGGLC